MIDWYSVYAARPSGPSSRPMPDFLKPPKGERMSTIMPELTATQPVRTRAATRAPRSMSGVQTEPHRPYGESLAIAIASSSLP